MRCVRRSGASDLTIASYVYSLWTNGWRALLIEGDVQRYKNLVRQHATHPQAREERVVILNRLATEEGADSLDCILEAAGFPADLDLLSIDVDGIDFHLWRGLKRCKPRVVVIEFNPIIPLHVELVGSATGNNVGCSLLSVTKLAREKGYSLVATVVWNAFFVLREKANSFVNADNIEELFDPLFLRYAMQAYTGEIFYSGIRPRADRSEKSAGMLVSPRPFCRDSRQIEHSSVELIRTPNTGRNIVKEALLHWLRPVKRFVRRHMGLVSGY